MMGLLYRGIMRHNLHIMWQLLIGVFIVLGGTAFAESVELDSYNDAQQLFIAGDYDEAQDLAESLGTSEAYLLASEALAAKVILGYYDKPNDPSKRARKLAKKAIELDPDNLDAQFHQVVTFGLETQSTGVLKAWRKKMPTRMRAEIEALQVLAPDDPRGHALLGAWHLGIVNKVGKRNAYSWYKASPDMGTALYETALELAEDDIVITSNYAASKILLGEPDAARELLSSVVNMTSKHAAEAEIQKRMTQMLALYDDPKALERAAKLFLNNKRF